MSWLAAICREVAHVMPSYAVTPCSRAISASPWARIAITRAGPVSVGCVAATSRATCAMSTAPTMLRWRLLSVRFRSTRLAIWSGVAHPVGVDAVAAIAARTSLAARVSAGSGRLSGLVNSPHRFASRLHATWAASNVTVTRSTISGSIALFTSAASVTTVAALAMSA